MSKKLYQLGSWFFTHRWYVLSSWLVLFVVLGVLAGIYHKPYSTSFSIPGTPSIEALDKLSHELPAASKGSGTVVFSVPSGHSVGEQKAAIDEVVARLAQVDGVARVVSPFVAQTISPDGRYAFASVQLDMKTQDVPVSLQDAAVNVSDSSRTAALDVEVRGDLTDVKGSPAGASGEVAGVVVAALVLLITFGSLVAAGMPLLIAIVAVSLGALSVSTASGFLTLSSTAPALGAMLGLAVGIDYSLFLIVRYIKYLKDGHAPGEAVGRMVATAGNAVIFAALTVVIALAALSVVGIPFLTTMGLFAALTVAIAALAAISIVPAILSFAKYRVVERTSRHDVTARKLKDEDDRLRRTVGFRWVNFVTRRPVAVIVVAVVILGVVAIPASKLYLGLPNDSSAAKSSTQRKAYDQLSQGFGPGFNGPLLIVADLPSGLTPQQLQLKLLSIASNLKTQPGVATAIPAGVSPNGAIGILQAYPTTGPDAQATRDLIARIRSNAATIAGSGSTIAVTGETAVAVDVNNKLTAALPKYIIVVVGLSLLILLAVFRSILVPIKATAGFLLTILATLGLLVMFFQWGWLGLAEPAPILSFLPILVTGILFGLAMDYQFFLVSGMHEEYVQDPKQDAHKAVVIGFAHGARVVTVAAIIMISVFTGFIFSGNATIEPIGFALAAGVLIDAFVVRMTIVPAVMALFGRSAWWLPAWLGKVIPNLSIEGDVAKLR